MAKNERTVSARRKAFDAHYSANPSELKGKTLDEAYAAMRREVDRRGRMDTRNGSIGKVRRGGDAVTRRISARSVVTEQPDRHATIGRGLGKVNVPIPNTKVGVGTRRGFNAIKNAGRSFDNRAQETVDKAHNDLAGKLGPIERRIKKASRGGFGK